MDAGPPWIPEQRQGTGLMGPSPRGAPPPPASPQGLPAPAPTPRAFPLIAKHTLRIPASPQLKIDSYGNQRKAEAETDAILPGPGRMRDGSPSAHPAELVQEKRAERACPSACPLRGLVNAQHLQGLPQGPSYHHHTGGTAIQAGSESQSPASETLGEDACMGVTP